LPHLAKGYERHMGTVVPDGHCVALVRECGGLPHTSEWRCGELVKGSYLASGTCIATFDPNGLYGNHTDGRSHAAILLSENTDGLLVCDQWKGQVCHKRLISFRAGTGDAVNDGDKFYAIELVSDVGV
jgi:hypothetical protein